MTQYRWGKRSLHRLNRVHPNLIAVATLALTNFSKQDLTVLEGARTEARQLELMQEGVTWTLKSKHLLQPDGYAHALDLAPLPIDWDNWTSFERMNEAMQQAAMTLGIEIIWGGDWKVKDGPHFELA